MAHNSVATPQFFIALTQTLIGGDLELFLRGLILKKNGSTGVSEGKKQQLTTKLRLQSFRRGTTLQL
jgi:hypothetical protein